MLGDHDRQDRRGITERGEPAGEDEREGRHQDLPQAESARGSIHHQKRPGTKAARAAA